MLKEATYGFVRLPAKIAIRHFSAVGRIDLAGGIFSVGQNLVFAHRHIIHDYGLIALLALGAYSALKVLVTKLTCQIHCIDGGVYGEFRQRSLPPVSQR